MKQVLFEASSIEQIPPTGVNYFARNLATGLIRLKDKPVAVGFLLINFLFKKKLRKF